MPPLGQYFSRLAKKARRAHGCPQRAGIMDPWQFFPANQRFLGVTNGATMPVMDPQVVRHLSADQGSRRRDVVRRLCPRWASTSRLPSKTAISVAAVVMGAMPPVRAVLLTAANVAGGWRPGREGRQCLARAAAPALRSLCSGSLDRSVRGLAPQPRFAADAETCLQGLVFGSVFSGRPDEHDSDNRQRDEDHDERDDSGNAGHSRQCCTDVFESGASSASRGARPRLKC
jgi:hypothetical protein